MADESELLRALMSGMTEQEKDDLVKAINEAPPPKPDGVRAAYRRRRRTEEKKRRARNPGR